MKEKQMPKINLSANIKIILEAVLFMFVAHTSKALKLLKCLLQMMKLSIWLGYILNVFKMRHWLEEYTELDIQSQYMVWHPGPNYYRSLYLWSATKWCRVPWFSGKPIAYFIRCALAITENMFLQLDGCPAHFSRNVQGHFRSKISPEIDWARKSISLATSIPRTHLFGLLSMGSVERYCLPNSTNNERRHENTNTTGHS